MSLVLAVEPDGKQAEILRRLIGQQAGTQLILVTSAYAATVTMNRRVPDLVLLGASLDKKSHEHVFDHFILASDVPEPQTLQIPPQLEDSEFGVEIEMCLARAEQQQRDRRQPEEEAEILLDLESSSSEETPIDLDVHAAHLAMVQAEAEARLASELERVRSEAAEQRAAELARLQAEADAQLRAEVSEARAAAAADARNALTAELADARREAEQTLATELARVRDEAAQRLADELQHAETSHLAAVEQARIAAEKSASLALDEEAERIRVDTEARLTAEIRRVHEEAEQARRAQEQTEAAAARALEAEVERVRMEADARLQEELARVRAEIEQTREAQHGAQIDAEAARAHEVEVARTEAEARLRAELERMREETNRDRLADQSEMERVRGDAEREARARADAMLQAEIARARADADARLASEMAGVRAEAQRRRVAELAEIRAQLDQAREAAREQASLAAAEAVFAEVARAEIAIPGAAARAADAGRQAVSATAGALRTTIRWLGTRGRAALSVARQVMSRLPPRALPPMAVLLLVGGGLAFMDVSSLTRRGTSVVRSTSGTAVTMVGNAAQSAQTQITARLAPSVAETAGAPTTGAEPATAGLLDVFSRVPLDLYVSGRRIGTTEDGQIVLAPGRYRVGLVNTRLNYRGEATLDIQRGAVTSHNVLLPNGRLQLDTEPGAEVWIEGKRAGVAPLGALPVPIGTREIVVRHPNLGERRAFVEVRYGDVTTMSIRLREAPSDVP